MTKEKYVRSAGTGFVVIRLRAEGNRNSDARTLEEHAKQSGLPGIAVTLEKLGNPKSERLIRVASPEKIHELERRAAQTEFPPLHSLTQYWKIDFRDRNHEEIETALALLHRTREVEMAEEELLAVPALVTPGDDDFNTMQGYQDAAPAVLTRDGCGHRPMAKAQASPLSISKADGASRMKTSPAKHRR
jgi:hypothetical protein